MGKSVGTVEINGKKYQVYMPIAAQYAMADLLDAKEEKNERKGLKALIDFLRCVIPDFKPQENLDVDMEELLDKLNNFQKESVKKDFPFPTEKNSPCD